ERSAASALDVVTDVVPATVIAAVAMATAWRRVNGVRGSEWSLIVCSFDEG
ncbi:MAG: hypothetical protein QOI83_1128, partial [Streptomycetaceae bacterium]|nr:hypothetical protein [Streptomycetaceae bacterium]